MDRRGGGDAAEVLELAEEALDLVAFAVERPADAGRSAFPKQHSPDATSRGPWTGAHRPGRSGGAGNYEGRREQFPVSADDAARLRPLDPGIYRLSLSVLHQRDCILSSRRDAAL